MAFECLKRELAPLPYEYLLPEWVDAIPSRYRSLGVSIDNHYRPIVGNPTAVRDLAQDWWCVSKELEPLWQDFDRYRYDHLNEWSSEAAEQFRVRAETWSGQVSAISKSLNYAAVGFHVLSRRMVEFELAARNKVIVFINFTNDSYRIWTGSPGALRLLDVQVLWLARTTQSAVIASATALDAVLASMPKRFVLGPNAPWAKGIAKTNSTAEAESDALKLQYKMEQILAGQSALEMGLTINEALDGTIVVGVSAQRDDEVGIKASSDDIPDRVKDKLRVAGGIDASYHETWKVTQGYRFDTKEEALAFIDNAHSAADKVRIRLGTGPIKPDSTTYAVQGELTGKVEVGVEKPFRQDTIKGKRVYGGSGRGSRSASYTSFQDGGYATGFTHEEDYRGSVTTGSDGAAKFQRGDEGGQVRAINEITVHNSKGEPTKFIKQKWVTRDTLKHSVKYGFSGAPFKNGEPSRDILGGGFSRITSRETHTDDSSVQILDLEVKANGDAYARRTADPGSWQQRIEDHGVRTFRTEPVEKVQDATTAKYGLAKNLELEGTYTDTSQSKYLEKGWYKDETPDIAGNPTYPRRIDQWTPEVYVHNLLRDSDPGVTWPYDARNRP